jgi:effector-binding domain-containing protein
MRGTLQRVWAAMPALALVLSAAQVTAQTPPAASPPVATPPAPPSVTSPAAPPSVTLTQPDASAGVAPPRQPDAGATLRAARPTLIPQAGDPTDVDEVVLPEKPVVIVSGQSKWDDGLKTIRAALARLESELGKVGIPPAGRPLAVFVQTTDEDFKFDAMVPVGAVPTPPPALPPDLRFGTTPSGKAYRFVHKGRYDDVDSTYETITTYLDAKDILAKDAFIEEYVNDVADATNPGIEVNIFVQPR